MTKEEARGIAENLFTVKQVGNSVIKRSGKEVPFDEYSIITALLMANEEVDPVRQLSDHQILAIADDIADEVDKTPHAVGIEEIQDKVVTGIFNMRSIEVGIKYIAYRYKRELARKSNSTDDAILSLIDRSNEEVKQENSNKNPVINSTQRDYMAGEVSKDLTNRVLLPEDVVKAHKEGIIHFHDADYFASMTCFRTAQSYRGQRSRSQRASIQPATSPHR